MEATKKHLLRERLHFLWKADFPQFATPAERGGAEHLKRARKRDAPQMHARAERLARHFHDALGQQDLAHGTVVGERTMSDNRHPFGHDDAFPIA